MNREKSEKNGLTAIDLYCGSGAVTWGLRKAGFSVLGAVDIDPIAGKTYTKNHPKVNFKEIDITQVDFKKDFTQLPKKIDLLAVCAPCQPFSNRNKRRSATDDRVVLILESLKFVERFKPKVIFFENVPGLERNAVFEELVQKLKALKYYVSEPTTLDAANLGVPQRRPRMVLVATKMKSMLEDISDFKSLPRINVKTVIGDLPSPVIGQANCNGDLLHFSRRHHAITLERLKHIPKDGGSRDALPEHLVLECHKALNKNQFPDCYGRMSWDDVAPTLTTGCTDLTKGRYTHPEEDRAITLREAARLQTFPDSYFFEGNAAQIASQIGNAVPPEMMANIAKTIAQAI